MGDEAPTTCKVLVVEDDRMFRGRLSEVVLRAADMELVGTAATVADGARMLGELQPDVALVDLLLPDGHGIELIRQAREMASPCETLVVTVFDDDDSILRCIKAGAGGYVLKDEDDLTIARHIREVRAGRGAIGASIARRVLNLVRRLEPSGPARVAVPGPRLSQQEQKVLALFAQGFSNPEAAHRLQLSTHTVGEYVKRIYRKLQVHSKVDAIREARRGGWLPD